MVKELQHQLCSTPDHRRDLTDMPPCADPADVPSVGYEIGRRLSRLMKEQSFSDRSLAERANTTHGTIYRIRHGAGTDTKFVTLYNLAQVLQVAPEWFLFGIAKDVEAIRHAIAELSPADRRKLLEELRTTID